MVLLPKQAYWSQGNASPGAAVSPWARGPTEHCFLQAFVGVGGEQADFLRLGSELVYCHFCRHVIGQAGQMAKHKVMGWDKHGTSGPAMRPAMQSATMMASKQVIPWLWNMYQRWDMLFSDVTHHN